MSYDDINHFHVCGFNWMYYILSQVNLGVNNSLQPLQISLVCVLDNAQRLSNNIAGIAQLVEHDLAKVGVAGSNPVSRSIY